MNFQAKKLSVIREIIALRNEKIIDKLISLLNSERRKKYEKNSARNFLGVITEDEAEKMKRDIEEACERINEEDWK